MINKNNILYLLVIIAISLFPEYSALEEGTSLSYPIAIYHWAENPEETRFSFQIFNDSAHLFVSEHSFRNVFYHFYSIEKQIKMVGMFPPEPLDYIISVPSFGGSSGNIISGGVYSGKLGLVLGLLPRLSPKSMAIFDSEQSYISFKIFNVSEFNKQNQFFSAALDPISNQYAMIFQEADNQDLLVLHLKTRSKTWLVTKFANHGVSLTKNMGVFYYDSKLIISTQIGNQLKLYRYSYPEGYSWYPSNIFKDDYNHYFINSTITKPAFYPNGSVVELLSFNSTSTDHIRAVRCDNDQYFGIYNAHTGQLDLYDQNSSSIVETLQMANKTSLFSEGYNLRESFLSYKVPALDGFTNIYVNDSSSSTLPNISMAILFIVVLIYLIQ